MLSYTHSLGLNDGHDEMYREVAEEESEHRSHISLMLFSIPALLHPANRRRVFYLIVGGQ